MFYRLFVIIGVLVVVMMLLVSLIIGALEHLFKVVLLVPEGPPLAGCSLLLSFAFDMICDPGVDDVGLSTSIIAIWDVGVFIEDI